MNDRLRHFLNLDGDRQAGRWFSAVLVVGALAVGYSVVTDWDANSLGQRGKAVAALLTLAGLAFVYFKRPARAEQLEDSEPPA